MTNYRANLISKWRDMLEARPSNNNVIAIGVPLGEMADIAIDALCEGEGVPRIPTYQPDLFGDLRWTEPLDVDLAYEGEGFTTISTDLDAERDGVRIVVTDGQGVQHPIVLPPAAADAFALAVLAVSDAVDK